MSGEMVYDERCLFILDAAPFGLALLTLDETVAYANLSLCALLGRSREALFGRGLAELLHPDDPELDARRTLAMLRGAAPSVEAERRVIDSRGEVAWVTVTLAVVPDSGGAPARLLATFDDLGARRRDREAMLAARDEAERALRSREAFLATVTHELRTPLHAVLGFGRVLERETHGPLNAAQREYLGHLLESGGHMLKLVDALLDLRRLEDGRATAAPGDADVGAAVARAVKMVEGMAVERKQRLEVSAEQGLPRCRGDDGAIVQCCVNLLTNAVKFTPEGGAVSVRVRAWHGNVRVDVSDDGPGIQAEEQERVFRYLQQADAAVPESLRGAGIGLALVRALARQMGASLSLDSAPGRGTTISLLLRAAPLEAS